MSENKSGSFRKKKINFAQVSNCALRDMDLSLKAKGLFSLIQSYITIEDFTLYKNFLKSQCKEGEKSFESTWKELKDAGYLIQYRFQDSKTKQFYYEYDLLDEKDVELANKVHSQQNRKRKEEKSANIAHTPKKDGMVKKEEKDIKAIPTKKDGMAISCYGKRGVYNNTNINNTNINNTESISTVDCDLRTLFEENICDLKKTTSIKFENYIDQYDYNFIKAVILYCIRCNAKSFSYFDKTIKQNIKLGRITAPQFSNSVVNYMDEKYKENTNKLDKSIVISQKDSFNNFEQRKYDFDQLEKDLLGW